jgi:outer membrane protein TolC
VTVAIPAAKPDQWHFGMQVMLPVSDWFLRAGVASDAGWRAEAAARFKTASELRRASLEAVEAYWNLVRVGEAEEVAEESIADARARLGETNKRVAAQVASPADVKLAEARVAETEGARAELAHARRLIEIQLATMLDLPRGTPIHVSGEATAAGPVGTTEELIDEAWERRPEPQALSAAEEAYRKELELAGVGRLPRFDLVANAQVVNPNPRAFPQEDELVGTWDASAVLSWQVDALWRTGPEEDEVRAKMRALAADRRALEDGIELEIALAQRVLADAESKRVTSEAMLAAAEEGHRVRSKLYALGQATSIEVAEAETQLERARLGVVDARIERHIGEARLAYALGRGF